MKSKLETITNATLLVVALLVGSLVLYNQFGPKKDEVSKQVIGHHLNFSPANPLRADRTLVLFLSTQCGYCAASTPFYRKLVEAHLKMQIIAAFPQNEAEARKYLAEQQIPISQVISAPQFLHEIQGTPTLMVVDKTGKVVNAWVGRLPPQLEEEVMKEVAL